MKRTATFTAAAAACLLLTSCMEKETFTTAMRTPARVEFHSRTLPYGFIVGYESHLASEPVDLGLSVTWSQYNLGAMNTSDPGDLYAWGEISPSGNYGWQSYEFNDYHPDDEYSLYITKYCFDRFGEYQDLDHGGVELDPYDDAAYIHWGEGWRMPTLSEITELATKCLWEYSTATRTFKVTGPNGNSIMIPYGGVGIADKVYPDPEVAVITGGLWSSTLAENESVFACQLVLHGMDDDKFEMGVNSTGANRCFGCYIRPVFEGAQEAEN